MEGLKKEWMESLERRAREVGRGVKERVESTAQRMADARVPIRDGAAQPQAVPPAPGPIVPNASGQVPQAYEEPPVVARMIIEIRSDGTRTIARGALEDVLSDERVKIEASGGSPMQLAASLASNLLSTPFMLGRAANAVIKNRLSRGNKRD
jgi:hypothetical protein